MWPSQYRFPLSRPPINSVFTYKVPRSFPQDWSCFFLEFFNISPANKIVLQVRILKGLSADFRYRVVGSLAFFLSLACRPLHFFRILALPLLLSTAHGLWILVWSEVYHPPMRTGRPLVWLAAELPSWLDLQDPINRRGERVGFGVGGGVVYEYQEQIYDNVRSVWKRVRVHTKRSFWDELWKSCLNAPCIEGAYIAETDWMLVA